MTDISYFFMESFIVDLGDIMDDTHLLFGEDGPSLVVARENVDSHLHFVLDQSFEVDMIVDPLIQ